ncbi:Glycosyltransferase family 52 [Bacteroides faecichinchillae]|uniref:Glycosyltransferase family 52 n=1 Tax=Bacteroides faecichinchillae TaxID=871325 RepID=A0A1M5B8V9_9BACE|nr:glycosyltransferase family 52 [Bacteroides faecichinchillae]THG67517.1 lipooligosaccharide sialyltransferase [Bacteroides faecichinchillae]SHF38991.1 Glycosyltransferase family 52 [Bacteroides faecichinchillae]
MAKYKDIKAVCFLASTYSMLLYLLVYGKEQFESTFFFVSDAISEEVQKKMKYKKCLSYLKMIRKPYLMRVLYRFGLYCTSYFRWPFLKKLPIYGGDHLWFTPALLRKRTMVVLEDGLANYDINEITRTTNLHPKWLYKLLYGPIMGEGEYGYPRQSKKVVMTGIDEIPQCVKNKATVIDLNKMWNQSEAQEYIKYLFDFDNEDISMLKGKKVIILTQPYNQDVGDDVMINIYGDIIAKYQPEDVLLKTHPRDSIDYTKVFPNITVYSRKLPAELFALVGIHFDDVYTIDSTAIYSFPKDSRLHYLGLECHPRLEEQYGKSTIKGPSSN